MASKDGLSTIEKSILRELEQDSRMSLSRLGKRIRRSQQNVSYTVNSLMKRGVIQNLCTLIDYLKLNVLNFRVYFKVSYISKKKFEELISCLVSEPHTCWIATCGGRYDLVCTFFASNPSRFNKTLRGIMSEFPDQLRNYTVLTTVVNREFGRKYLFRASFPPEIIFGGDREAEHVDETDMKILEQLSAEARKSSVEMSRMLSVTPKTVIERVKRLRKRNLILGFKPLLDPRRMGYIPKVLVIRYHNVSSELENELIEYLKMHPHVTKIVKTLGEWDIEIFMEAEDSLELRRTEMDIRQKFAALIQQIESIPIYHTYKENYFPRFLLDGKS